MRPSVRQTIIPAVTFGLALGAAVPALGQTTEIVSVDSSGNVGNNESSVGKGAISADGRYVAFSSAATNLVPNDTNFRVDVFVRDRQAETTERVSVKSDGTQGNNNSGGIGTDLRGLGMSADGRYVVFGSAATNLVDNDTNSRDDIFLHDRQTGTTTRVSVDSSGNQGDGHCSSAAITPDGRYVAFVSFSTNLVADDTNNKADVFVHDTQTGNTERVSVDSNEVEGNGHAFQEYVSMSADGRYVAFESDASNLVPGDTNGWTDVFVRDRQAGTTERVSVNDMGDQGNQVSYRPTITDDGRYVIFESFASNFSNMDAFGNDIYLRDRQAGTTTLVSVGINNTAPNQHSETPTITPDGRFAAFVSLASNIVNNDTNGSHDVFLTDLQTGVTERVSLTESNGEGDSDTFWYRIAITPDARFVAFDSGASNMVGGDTNFAIDVFVRDRGGPSECVADITAAEVTFGANQGAQDPAKLEADDGDRTIAKSRPFLSALEPNLALLQVTANFACLGPGPQVTIDTQDNASQPGVTCRVRLKPAGGGANQQVGTYAVSFNVDQDHQIVVADGGDFIDGDGDIIMELRYSTLALLSPLGFDARTDLVMFTAE